MNINENTTVLYGAQCALLLDCETEDDTLLLSRKTHVEENYKHNDDNVICCSSQKEISLDSGYFSTSDICLNLDDGFEISGTDSSNQLKTNDCKVGLETEFNNSEGDSIDDTKALEKGESGINSIEDTSRCQSFVYMGENPLKMQCKEKTLFADEKTFHCTPAVQKDDNNEDDDDEDDPFFLSIKMLAKLPMIGKPRFKTGSITDTGFQPRVKPLYGKPENKVTIPNNDVPPLDKPPNTAENAEGAGRGRIMSTGHALPLEKVTSASAKGKSKIVVKESKDPKKEKSESGKKKKKRKK